MRPVLSLMPIFALLSFLPPLQADKSEDKPFAEQHVIFQVSDADPAKYTTTLDIANNLIKHYQGPDFVDIEVIAFGSGVQMLLEKDNPDRERISSLMKNGVRFYVCLNTLDTMQRRTGHRPVILPGVEGVQTGVAFMIEEIQAGYTHVHP